MKEKELQEQIEITLKGKSFSSKMTVGKIVNSHKLMSIHSAGQYQYMNNAVAVDIIAIVSFVEAFFPELVKESNVETLFDLSPIDFRSVQNQIVKKFLPWYNDWINEMKEEEK